MDRTAIVTQVHPRRIDFRMLSGHETWRSPGNLRQLTDQEIASLSHNVIMDGNPLTVMSKLTSGMASTLGDMRSNVQRTSINEPMGHRRNRRCQSGRRYNWTPQSCFKSSVKGLEDVVYDCGLPNSSQDLFTTTTERIGEYVAKTYEHVGEFQTGLMNLSFPILEKPRDPGKYPTFTQQQEFKSEYENWNKARQ